VHHLFSCVFDEVRHLGKDRQHPFLSLPWTTESFAVRVRHDVADVTVLRQMICVDSTCCSASSIIPG